jgi:leucyl aminopeptidase
MPDKANVRDLVNTPAADLGPAELHAEVEVLGKTHGAKPPHNKLCEVSRDGRKNHKS